MRSYLDFEKPVAELEAKVEELRALGENGDAVAITDDIARLEAKAADGAEGALRQAHALAEDPGRAPSRSGRISSITAPSLITEFTPLAGDRKFGEDEAIVGGFGRFRGQPVCVIGQEKGHDTESRIRHNFGMARPEGYRKAVRLMEMADRFGLPVITFVDTAGAYPGIEAEERGQAEAIARSTEACLGLGVPNVAVDHRRRRLGRRHRDRHRQQGADARARDLQRDLARGRGLDPVARCGPGPGCRHQHEDHGAGPAAARHHRRHRRGARRAAPIASRKSAIEAAGNAIEEALHDLGNMPARPRSAITAPGQVPQYRPQALKSRAAEPADFPSGRAFFSSKEVRPSPRSRSEGPRGGFFTSH